MAASSPTIIGEPGCSAVTGPDVKVGALIDGGGGANDAEDLALDDVVPEAFSPTFDPHPTGAKHTVRMIDA
ncbi:hypothetical protein B1T43_27050, partial [Mycobacterium kansasii]